MIFVGCAFVAFGLLEFVVSSLLSALVKLPFVAKSAATPEIGGLANLADAFARLAEALAKLPSFALATLLGIFIIAIGQRLLSGELVLPY